MFQQLSAKAYFDITERKPFFFFQSSLWLIYNQIFYVHLIILSPQSYWFLEKSQERGHKICLVLYSNVFSWRSCVMMENRSHQPDLANITQCILYPVILCMSRSELKVTFKLVSLQLHAIEASIHEPLFKYMEINTFLLYYGHDEWLSLMPLNPSRLCFLMLWVCCVFSCFCACIIMCVSGEVSQNEKCSFIKYNVPQSIVKIMLIYFKCLIFYSGDPRSVDDCFVPIGVPTEAVKIQVE